LGEVSAEGAHEWGTIKAHPAYMLPHAAGLVALLEASEKQGRSQWVFGAAGAHENSCAVVLTPEGKRRGERGWERQKSVQRSVLRLKAYKCKR
jgi:hypothetical protein